MEGQSGFVQCALYVVRFECAVMELWDCNVCILRAVVSCCDMSLLIIKWWVYLLMRKLPELLLPGHIMSLLLLLTNN